MIVTFTSFKLPKPIGLERAGDIFESTAPQYLGVAGLIRKHYVLSESGDTAGGIYFWKDRASAEAMYSPQWRELVRSKNGVEPVVTYMHSPITVDNDANAIQKNP